MFRHGWFAIDGLLHDMQNRSNITAFAGKKFREVAAFSELTFKEVKERHLQSP